MERIRLGFEKKWLHLTAGLMWSGVGVYLCYLAVGWLLPVPLIQALRLALGGFLLALAIYRFGFSTLVQKNIQRIFSLQKEKPSIFAFQKWTNYPLVTVMIALGITLRHSPLPKLYLAVLYIGIGGGLFLSSLAYYPHVRSSQS